MGLGLKRLVELAGRGFLKILRKKLMVWPWHGMALRKKLGNFEEEVDGLDERERIVNYTIGQFFKHK